MTLILTVASSAFVLQVSDRLVTHTEFVFDAVQARFTEVPRAFDPAANKVVIYHARNGILTLGYSGRAYVGGIPTDQWLAELLYGESILEMQSGSLATLSIGKAPHWLDVGQVIATVREASTRSLVGALGRRAECLEVIIAGYQWKRRRCWPISCELRFNSIKGAFDTYATPRYWHLPRRDPHADPNARWAESRRWPMWLIATPNRAMRDEKLIEVTQRFAATGPRPAAWAEIFSETIRETAGRSGYVGRDCMSVLILPPSVQCRVEVDYISQTVARAVLVGTPSPIEIEVAYSPWVLGPMIAEAPSISTGTSIVSSGSFTIEMRGPKHTRPRTGISFLGSQHRPNEPRRRRS
jgi:hypothetical protein